MKNIIKFQKNLLKWFENNKRDLPWRRTYVPYHVWISEIMLQQTQMERVVGYFNKWIERFPSIASIAEADEEVVLRYWEGLGYYSRARNIHKTARLLRHNNNGLLYTDYKDLLSLPGIGKYTAGALMSIAYAKDYPLVDANIERVFARVFNIGTPIKDKANKEFVWETAERLIPPGQARLFNQALMELGALICLPARPHCTICPIIQECESYSLSIVDERPLPGKCTDIIKITMASAILVHNGKVFIQKRPENGIWANLWEFPGGRVEGRESPEKAVKREFLEETELEIDLGKKISVIKHSYTRYRVTLHCFFCTLPTAGQKVNLHEAQEYKWIKFDELETYAFPSPHRQLINQVHAQNIAP